MVKQTMGDLIAAGNQPSLDEIDTMQDRIHKKHSEQMDRLAADTVGRIERYSDGSRALLDAYYMDRRAAEREYVGALNATARIERFLSK